MACACTGDGIGMGRIQCRWAGSTWQLGRRHGIRARTGDGVGAVKGELHIVLGGDAEDALDVADELRVAVGAALHRHVVHLHMHAHVAV